MEKEKVMRKSKQITIMFFSFVFLGTSLTVNATSLADRHASRGIKCNSCHTQEPPSTKNTGMKNCLACHGSTYAILAKRTAKKEINFHDTHVGEVECKECHNGHKPSQLLCDQCHEFPTKVP